MPRTPQLNWEPSRGKWKVVYRGWVMEDNGTWYQIDRMTNGNINRTTGLIRSSRPICPGPSLPRTHNARGWGGAGGTVVQHTLGAGAILPFTLAISGDNLP